MAKNNDDLAILGNSTFEAVYTEQINEDYIGNPFIEALPPKLTPEKAIDIMTYIPRHSSEERKLDAGTRYDCVQRLFKYFEPLGRHLELERKISSIIRNGYVARNPLTPQEAARLQLDYRIRKCGDYDIPDKGFETSATGLTIIGISGMGKSTTINRVLSYYPQVIMHTKYHGINLNRLQLVWLKLDCPFDGSIKGLCINFFQAVDDLVGTNYYKRYGNARDSADAMLPRMKQIARLYGLGLLAIDEIQHLSTAHSGGSEKMLNFFVTLVNTIGVPVVLIGTPGALSVLQAEFRQARRGSGQGDGSWDRLENDDNWDLLINGMWKYQWMQNYVPLTKEIKEALYYESQGIIDLVIKIYALAQWKAISSGEENITPDLIKEVAEESLQLVRPMIDALKSGNMKEIFKYHDIRPVDITANKMKYFTNLQSNIGDSKDNPKSIEDSKKEIADEIIFRLLGVGIAADKAQKAAYEVLNTNHQIKDINEASALALAIVTQMPKPKPAKKAAKKEITEPDDLRFIVLEGRKNKKSAYESLKEQGVFRCPISEFIEV